MLLPAWFALALAAPHMHDHDTAGTDVVGIVEELSAAAESCGIHATPLTDLDTVDLDTPHDVARHAVASWLPTLEAPPTLVAAHRAIHVVCLERAAHGWEVGASTWQPLTLEAPLPQVDNALAGERLGVALLATLDRATLSDALVSWDALGKAVGPEVRAMMEGDGAHWSTLLADPDGDGLVTLQERIGSTDPEARGGPWWDGAPTLSGVVLPLPLDETFSCFDVRPAPDTLGKLTVWRRAADGGVTQVLHKDASNGMVLPPSFPGEIPTIGLWARLEADEVVPYATCVHHPTATVRLEPTSLAPLRLDLRAATVDDASRLEARATLTTIGDAMDAVAPRFTSALGSPAARAYVQLIGGASNVARTTASWPRVELDARLVRPLLKKKAADVAGVALALHYVGLADNARISRLEPAVALWTAVSPDPVSPALLGADAATVKRWIQVAKACPTGWVGLLDKTCRGPR